MGDSVDSDLAIEWESCRIIRGRFRKQWTWIQWPVNAVDAAPDDHPDDEDAKAIISRHPVCTKALELNASILERMLEHYQGHFVDVPTVQKEACLFFKLVIVVHTVDMVCIFFIGLCIGLATPNSFLTSWLLTCPMSNPFLPLPLYKTTPGTGQGLIQVGPPWQQECEVG